MERAEAQQSEHSLIEGQLYAMDGGVFRAVRSSETDQLELWTHDGESGRVIARTGLVMDGDGKLYNRVFDFASERHTVADTPCGTLADLQPVSEAELGRWARQVRQRTGAGTKPDAGIWKR